MKNFTDAEQKKILSYNLLKLFPVAVPVAVPKMISGACRGAKKRSPAEGLFLFDQDKIVRVNRNR